MLSTNVSYGQDGILRFGGVSTEYLADKYKTPLYLVDTDRISENCRVYRDAVVKHFGDTALSLFASKALCYKNIYRVISKWGIGADVVSAGEIYTAVSAGFDAEKLYFHGNILTDEDMEIGLKYKVGYFIIDNFEGLALLDKKASEMNVKQKVLLRLSPSIDPHTHRKVATGGVDSKFGVPIETGQAFEFVKQAQNCKNLVFCGLHCHIGSQIFDSSSHLDSADVMLSFAAKIKKELGAETKILDLGGGIAVRYTEDEPEVCMDSIMQSIATGMKEMCKKHSLTMPAVRFEMGRFVCADAGMTLYTVGAFKEIKGIKNYIIVDGGMADNPRYALYQSKYTVLNVKKPQSSDIITATVAGRTCESGDVIQEDIKIGRCGSGDKIAVLTTGAYNYTMSSNYNRLPKPAIVEVCDGKDCIAVERETLLDLISKEH